MAAWKLRSLVVGVFLFSITALTASADEPLGDFGTIQAAIDSALPETVVVVPPGVYSGPGNCDLIFHGKTLTLRSEDPSDPAVVAATLIDCMGSAAEPHRGFILRAEDTDPIIEGLTITGGYENIGGAVSCSAGSCTIRNCVITDNTSVETGGGIAVRLGATVCLESCQLIANTAGTFGGAVTSEEDGFVQLTSCSIVDNSAIFGGGVYCEDGEVLAVSCLLSGNRADSHGGGLYSLASQTDFVNCSFVGNWAAFFGGGLRCFSESLLAMSNCIVRSNRVSSAGSGDQFALSDEAVILDDLDELTIRNSDVELGFAYIEPGIELPLADACNIDADPLFVDSGYWDPNGTGSDPDDDFWVAGDYRLTAGSLCMDAGDDSAVSGFPYDLAESDRVFGGAVDLGAYELAYNDIVVNSFLALPGAVFGSDLFLCSGKLDGVAPDSAEGAEYLTVGVGPNFYQAISFADDVTQLGTLPFYLYRGAAGELSLLLLNLSGGTLTMFGTAVPLTGLSSPVPISMSFGDYQAFVSHPVSGLSPRFMNGYKDTLSLSAKPIVINGALANTDMMIARGNITLKYPLVDLKDDQIDIMLRWGETFEDSFSGAAFSKSGSQYIYTKPASDTEGKIAMMLLNTSQGYFFIMVRNAELENSGTVDFGVSFGSFDQVVPVDL